MYVAQIWRYPVKSMGGERLTMADLDQNGVHGDRMVQVREGRNRILTARTHPALLRHKATLEGKGEPRIDGKPWNDPAILAELKRELRTPVRLTREADPHRFDILPLLVATDGAIAAFGEDGRRLRPNVVIGGVPGLTERQWEGRQLRIGDVVIQLADLRGRCVMTTVHPDTGQRDPEILKRIYRDFEGTLALNAAVSTGGQIAEGDPVELLDAGAPNPNDHERR